MVADRDSMVLVYPESGGHPVPPGRSIQPGMTSLTAVGGRRSAIN